MAAWRGDGAFAQMMTRSRAIRRGAGVARRTPTPFERARTELSLEERRRRARRAREAGSRWRRRCRRSSPRRRAVGGEGPPRAARDRRPTAPAPTVVERGTHTQDLQAALTVAGGATNKEAATALLTITKTVEYPPGEGLREARAALARRRRRRRPVTTCADDRGSREGNTPYREPAERWIFPGTQGEVRGRRSVGQGDDVGAARGVASRCQ